MTTTADNDARTATLADEMFVKAALILTNRLRLTRLRESC
jgi:hypothetical protein